MVSVLLGWLSMLPTEPSTGGPHGTRCNHPPHPVRPGPFLGAPQRCCCRWDVALARPCGARRGRIRPVRGAARMAVSRPLRRGRGRGRSPARLDGVAVSSRAVRPLSRDRVHRLRPRSCSRVDSRWAAQVRVDRPRQAAPWRAGDVQRAARRARAAGLGVSRGAPDSVARRATSARDGSGVGGGPGRRRPRPPPRHLGGAQADGSRGGRRLFAQLRLEALERLRGPPPRRPGWAGVDRRRACWADLE